MNERIKQLRTTLGITQQKFADRIGVKRNTVAQYETGRNEPIDAVFTLICREFGVNEEWLRNGNGEMFVKLSRNEETAALVARIVSDTDNPLKAAFLHAAAELIDDDNCYHVIESNLLEIIELIKNKTE